MTNDSLNPSVTQDPRNESNEFVTIWREIDITSYRGMMILNRVIALRSGWQIVPTENSEYRGQRYSILNPYGDEVEVMMNRVGIQNYAFPNYAQDANLALALVPDTVSIRMNCSFSRDTGKPVYWVSLQHWNEYRDHDGYGTTRELALCLAWLSWSDAQPDAASGKREAGE